METFGVIAIFVVVGFIAFKVVQAKRKERNTPPYSGGTGGRKLRNK